MMDYGLLMQEAIKARTKSVHPILPFWCWRGFAWRVKVMCTMVVTLRMLRIRQGTVLNVQ